MAKLSLLFGPGTAVGDTFEVGENITEYTTVLWECNIEGGKRLRYRATRAKLTRKNQLSMAPGDSGGWAFATLRVDMLKDADGLYGPLGSFDTYTPTS